MAVEKLKSKGFVKLDFISQSLKIISSSPFLELSGTAKKCVPDRIFLSFFKIKKIIDVLCLVLLPQIMTKIKLHRI